MTSEDLLPDIAVSLSFSGTFDPDMLTESLRLQPSHTARRGEVRRKVVRIKDDMWSSVIGGPGHSVNDALEEAFSHVIGMRDRFLTIRGQADLEGRLRLAIAVVEDEQMGIEGIVLRPEWMATLGNVGLTFEVDFTILRPD